MGQGGRPFSAWKFRSMRPKETITRGAFDPLEIDRITGLGRILRRLRIDELPQILNVLRGEMSLIGPRPDYLPHAQDYLANVPGYDARLALLPGITGYAQILHGYAEGMDGVRAKVAADLHYLQNASLRLDLWIAWRTALTVLLRRGA